jgi:nucleotide-binding universal stress UspA family protein
MADDPLSLLAMMAPPGGHLHPDYVDALEAYVAADKDREKAERALERADRLARQREAELRAVYERLTEVEG